MPDRPNLQRNAAVFAFILAGLVLIGALMGRIILAPFALIPLIGGVGIWRRRAWSAYGLAIYFSTQLLLIPLLLERSPSPALTYPKLVLVCVFSSAISIVFFLAGRSLAALPGHPGSPIPWIVLSLAVLTVFFFFQPFVVPTGSMDETILAGDSLLVRRLPKPGFGRGDLVVFAWPVDRSQTFIKRVIGIPGDRIRIVRKRLYLNGVPLSEPYAIHKSTYMDSYRDNFPGDPDPHPYASNAAEMLQNHVVDGEVVVPAARYFVLGDNRDASLDSRYWGFVSAPDLIGKPMLIYDSEDWLPADTASSRKFRGLNHVRWDRMFRVPR